MQDNPITIELGLPALLIEGQRQEGQAQIVTVRYRCLERPRPYCGRETNLDQPPLLVPLAMLVPAHRLAA